MSRHRTTARALLLVAILGLTAGQASALPDPGIPKRAPATPGKTVGGGDTISGKRIIFPVLGRSHYTNDFGDPRGQGRHEGIDIVAPKKSLAVAAEAGKVKFWTTSARAGCMLYLYGDSGTTYLYVHLNNDLALRNDNSGGCKAGTTYVAASGATVEAGELIAWNGDSGDAAGNPHLHFEVHPNDGADVNPLPYLKQAVHYLFPARVGTTFTLGLRGTMTAAGDGELELRATQVRWWPNGHWTVLDPRAVTVTVPDEAALDGDILGAVQGDPQRFTAKRDSVELTVFTAPATVTEAMLRGAPGALAAARISKR
jgi:Peptidase family M23